MVNRRTGANQSQLLLQSRELDLDATALLQIDSIQLQSIKTIHARAGEQILALNP